MKANGKYSLLSSSLLFLLVLAAAPASAQGSKAVHAEYYGEAGCSHCDLFAEKELPSAESRTGVAVDLELYDILSAAGYERCKNRLAERGIEFTIFPVLVIGNNIYQGNEAIEANLVPELSYYAGHGEYRPRMADKLRNGTKGSDGGGLSLSVVPVLAAGFVDGINPCAFTTLLFFVSFLSLRGGTRRRTAYIGLLFTLGVFASYFLIGLGLFNILRAGSRIAAFRLVLRLLVTCLTAVFCGLTLRDIGLLRRGKPSDMKLQLPLAIKRRIHSSIRGGVRSSFLPLGALASGIVVAVLELACTGQVYLPAISYMVQTDRSWLGVGGLLLYNTAFITPILIVLFLILIGTSQEAVRLFFERRVVFTKTALAVTFAALTVLIWLF